MTCKLILCPGWLLRPRASLWLPSRSFPTLSKSVPHFPLLYPLSFLLEIPLLVVIPCPSFLLLVSSVDTSSCFIFHSLISPSYCLFRMTKRQRRSFSVGIRHPPPRPKRRFLLSCELPKPTCVPVQSNPGRTQLFPGPLRALQLTPTSDATTIQPSFSSSLPTVLTTMSFLP